MRILFLIILTIALTILARPIIEERGHQFDFYPHYVGTAAYWQGESPYIDAVTERIQQGYYGGPLPSGGDEYRLPFPAYAYILFAPALLFDASTAIAIWMGLQGAFIVGALSLWMTKPTLGKLALTALLLVAYRYNVTVYLLGQFTGWVLLWLSLAVWCLEHHRDTAAGLCLALATIQPTLTGPLAAIFLLVYVRRWRMFAAFVILLGTLTLITFVQIGWWIPDWLANISRYTSYQPFVAWVPRIVSPLVIPAAVGLVLLVIWKRLPPADLYIAVVIALLMVVPQTGGYFLVLPLPALILALRRRTEDQKRLVYLAVAVLAISWIFQAVDLEPRKFEAFIIPCLLAALWWLTIPLIQITEYSTVE